MNNKPCKECPFRRDAAPGWLGDHESSREIANIVLFDGEFPCHMEVTKRTDRGLSFVQAVDVSPLCVGALAFLNNQFKLSRNATVSQAQKLVGKREDCFQFTVQMEKYHGR